MAKSIKSFRVDPDLWKRAEIRAEEVGMTTGAFVERALSAALGERNTKPATKRKARAKALAAPADAPGPKAILAEAEKGAAHLAVAPAPKTGRSKWNLSMLQEGPIVHPPGSLMKGEKSLKAKR